MRFTGLLSPLLLLAAGAVEAASKWSFDEGTIHIEPKKGGAAVHETFGPKAPLTKPVVLGAHDVVTVSLVAKDNGKPKVPHQAFILLKDEATGVEESFALDVRKTGKGKVEITHRQIPLQLLLSPKPVHATVVIGSFGSAEGLVAPVFDLELELDDKVAAPRLPEQVRYIKKERISHIFRDPPKGAKKVFSALFAAIILACLPALFGSWLLARANVAALPKAVAAAPLSHLTFFGSVAGIELVYYLYHTSWNLFQILPPLVVLGATAVLSGTKALGEVQGRRLAGER